MAGRNAKLLWRLFRGAMMNRISEITKRDILDLFSNGKEIEELFETKKITYPYFGRLEELEFLKRIYKLDELPSYDSRYPNAEVDIWQHTVNNDDYSYGWVFEDERFQLKTGCDEVYLKFICEIFHPTVRDEKGYWEEFLREINSFLRNDGYELYSARKISNRDIFDWRIYSPEDNKMFVPFSQRNAKEIKDKKITLSIKKSARNQIYQLLDRHCEIIQETSDTGWNYNISTFELVFRDIKQFYTPKCYNGQNQYVETSIMQDFIYNTRPYYVLDVIEFFEKYNHTKDFESQVNTLLQLNEISYKLENGRLISNYDISSLMVSVKEAGLSELLQEATRYYNENKKKIAVEKLWDAFERLKTYFSPALDKQQSSKKIISLMSAHEYHIETMFEKEFRELTSIGNDFRIRHHETTKIDVEDERHYEYFYKRCLSLISVAIQYLNCGGE